MDVHISYRDIEIEIITNLKVGDKLPYKGRNRTVIGFSYDPGMGGSVVFKRVSVSFGIVRDLYPHLKIEKYRTTLSDAKLHAQAAKKNFVGVTLDKTVYQLVHTLPDGSKFYHTPFTLCCLSDRKHVTDWTEWGIGNLPSPIEVDFVVRDGIITSISDTPRE